ncbi:hypothetical protein HPB50_024124 [Hyalomma asiaticum]|uniref:Uncharacterized protein n=1 Tax=Hyalomma asiaticum TaxID=266040 RepID=A0ACB7RNZ8_HYAAI|nr:hypothetical protein HPB50_024124 [Hyalomma asiaticum]
MSVGIGGAKGPPPSSRISCLAILHSRFLVLLLFGRYGCRVQYGLITHPAVLLVRHGRRRLHWVLQAASTACALLGIWAAFTHKAGLGKPHFTTWHSWTGIAALLLTLLEVAVGVAAMTFHASTVGTEKQCPWLKYTVLRRVHRALGLLAHGFATAAIVLGLRSHYGRQTLATALGDAVPLQLVVQALAVAPFASIVRHLWRRR